MNGIHVFDDIQNTVISVILAALPLVLFFVVFQTFMLKLRKAYVVNILKGTLLASVGLLLFLQGVHIGFLPFGHQIGKALGALEQKWVLAVFGLLLGFFTAWGEPSVRILADQVEEASGGSIRQPTVLYTISLGVAFFVGFGFFRIMYGIPLLYILIPGYLFVLFTMWFSGSEFLSIAVDAGGVATGPIANTFLLSLSLGLSSSISQGNPIMHGLGLVSLIALAPIISILLLGVILRIIKRKE